MSWDPTEDLETYNKLNQYNEMAETFSDTIENDYEIPMKEKRDFFYPLINEIKENAEELIENYVIWLKNKEDEELFNLVENLIDEILSKIDAIKNRIYDIHNNNLK